MPTETTCWFVDSSVVLRAVLNGSSAVKAWFDAARRGGDTFVGGRMLELEVRRVVRNHHQPQASADAYLSWFNLLEATNDQFDEAIALRQPISGADALHIVAATRFGTSHVTFATHDRQQAAVASALGFAVVDPVTDDANGTVAHPPKRNAISDRPQPQFSQRATPLGLQIDVSNAAEALDLLEGPDHR